MGDIFAKHVCKMQDQAFHRKNKEAWKIGMKSSFATLFLPFYSPYDTFLHSTYITVISAQANVRVYSTFILSVETINVY